MCCVVVCLAGLLPWWPALAPDLVAVTGDLVDGSVAALGDEVEPFAGLRAAHGVWFVTGNHDHYSGARAWARALSLNGVMKACSDGSCAAIRASAASVTSSGDSSRRR